MAHTQKTGSMTPFVFSKGFKKLGLLYFGFCLLFILIHLMLVSIFSFFHFLLDHEMGMIENWLSLNGWEIIAISKLFAFGVMTKLTQVNSYSDTSFSKELWAIEKIPSKKALALIFFLLVMFYSLLSQFGGGIQSNQILDELFLSSFIGSILFFGIDIVFIMVVISYFQLKLNHPIQLLCVLLILFLISSKIVLPYIGKYSVFLVVHFVSLFYLSRRNNLGDLLVYLAIVVAPLSSFFGIDLIWDNSYSIFTYSKELPVLGVFLIWTVALGYYHRSKLD